MAESLGEARAWSMPKNPTMLARAHEENLHQVKNRRRLTLNQLKPQMSADGRRSEAQARPPQAICVYPWYPQSVVQLTVVSFWLTQQESDV